MKNFLIALVMLLLASGYLLAQSAKNSGASEFRRLENRAFKSGEKLTFEVKYGFVKAGIATMEVPRIKKMSGRDVYQITFQVASIPSFDWFYKVRDRYETYMDTEGLFPWRFEQHIREGGYSRDFSAFFDQRKGKARTSGGEYNTPKYVNDIVSAFYLARTFDYSRMKKGDRIHLENFFNDKVFPLDVVYHGKEKITVAAGTFDCIIIEPLVVEGGLFKSDGNILIWLSDDLLKVPVRVKTKVVVGSIDAELIGTEGLAGRMTSKK